MIVSFLAAAARVVASVVVVLVIAISGGFWLAKRFADGPVGPIPGGPLRAGTLVEEGEIDPARIENRNIELELVGPATSRLTGLFYEGGEYVVPCDLGFVQPRIPRAVYRSLSGFAVLAKRWHEDAQRDGRAVVRVDGERYERRLVRITDPARIEFLRDLIVRKATEYFGEPLRPVATDPDAIWFFRLVPR